MMAPTENVSARSVELIDEAHGLLGSHVGGRSERGAGWRTARRSIPQCGYAEVEELNSSPSVRNTFAGFTSR